MAKPMKGRKAKTGGKKGSKSVRYMAALPNSLRAYATNIGSTTMSAADAVKRQCAIVDAIQAAYLRDMQDARDRATEMDAQRAELLDESTAAEKAGDKQGAKEARVRANNLAARGPEWPEVIRNITALSEVRRKLAATHAELNPRDYDEIGLTMRGQRFHDNPDGDPSETIMWGGDVPTDGVAIFPPPPEVDGKPN